jgi:hypothetical protein
MTIKISRINLFGAYLSFLIFQQAIALDASKYFGGSYDGYGQAASEVQYLGLLDASKYYGGYYDGYGQGISSNQFLGLLSAVKYSGGSYDGHGLGISCDQVLGLLTAAKYYGGSYDGHGLGVSYDQVLGLLTAAKYYGGSFDGYGQGITYNQILGLLTAFKYYGGSYDGYGQGTTYNQILGLLTATKYYGGSYDGHGQGATYNQILGLLAVAKYYGGSYDGHGAATSEPDLTFEYLTIGFPNGGESWQTGGIHDITWTSAGTSGSVKIEYSTNNGSAWTTIIANTPDDGTYSWTIPNTPSANCKVKVSDVDGVPSDQSNVVFTIIYAPFITVISPNGGEDWQAGSDHGITWTSSGTSGNVKIEYSRNNGLAWTTIIASTSDDGTHPWTVPTATSASYLVRITDTDGSPTDQSDALFTVARIIVSTPNGGENWPIGSSQQIKWSYSSAGDSLKIEYSTDNGSNWSVVVSSIASTGGPYTWKIPNAPSTTCLVRITDKDGCPTDQSNAVFTISAAPFITVNYPNGGESWMAGSSHDITWSSSGTSGNVRIEYSKDNGTGWSDVIASTADDGTHPWSIPNAPSAACIVRVSDTDGTPADTSDAVFTIVSATGSIAGAVLQEDGTTPVEDAKVELYDSGKNFVNRVFTWPSSGYAFANLMPGTYYIKATGYFGRTAVVEWYNNVSDPAGAQAVQVTPANPVTGINFTLTRPPAQEILSIYRAASPPVIDGEMDAAYAGAINTVVTSCNIDYEPPAGPDDARLEFRFLYDDSRLYFFGRAFDDSISTMAPNEWEKDSFEFYLDAGNGKTLHAYDNTDDIQIRFGHDDLNVLNVEASSGWGFSQAGISFKIADKDYGWNLEVSFPLADLKFDSPPVPDDSFGLDVHYNDNDSDHRNHKLHWWAISDNSWRDASIFGTAQFKEQSAAVQYAFAQAGWYMVSLPVTPSDNRVGVLFPDALGQMAFAWDQVNSSYLSVTEIEPKKGYWIAIPGAATSTVTGVPLYSYTEHFSAQGWYMIGSVMGSVDFSNPNDNPNGMVLSQAFGWDPVSESYVPTTTLSEKQGYWAAVYGACDLTVGSTEATMPKAFANANWEEFNRKTGSNPPPPPALDARTGKLKEIPKEYGLSQNYPNPFNPETTIEYQLTKSGHVSLAVYNMMGQVVRMLVDKEQGPGHHSVIWDGKDENGSYPGNGVYLVRMIAGEYQSTRKIILLK